MIRRRSPLFVWQLLLLTLVAGCPPAPIEGVAAHACALLDDGSIWCWGYNTRGELGDGTPYDRYRPVAVAGLPVAAVAVGAGDGFTCAATVDGRAFCWGRNDEGQLGDGTTVDRAAPTPVTGLAGVETIAVGRAGACAVLGTGEVLCWGVLGDETRAPRAVLGLPAAAGHADVWAYSACAVLSTQEVWCWGTEGVAWSAAISPAVSIALSWGGPCAALVDGSVTCADVALPGPAVAVDAGEYQQCALLADGEVWCWGRAAFGELGNSPNLAPEPYVSGAKAISLGNDFACALLGAGGVECWGDNWAGQLGDGTDRTRTAPVPVTGLPRPATAVAVSPGYDVTASGCGGAETPAE